MTNNFSLNKPIDTTLSPQTFLPQTPQFNTTLTRSHILSVLSGFMVLVLVVSAVIVWQNISNVREINRQKINTALEKTIASIQEQILVVELMAGSLQRIVQASDGVTQYCSENCLRTSLESAISAFEHQPNLSHLGLILPASGFFGNLERLPDGDIILWLPSIKDADLGEMQSLMWTDKGFMPYFSADSTARHDSREQENLRRLSVQETVRQGDQEGVWRLHASSWMMHQSSQEWSIGYSKALYDDNGRLVGVFDANFTLSSIKSHMLDLQEIYESELMIVEKGEPSRMIIANSLSPLTIPDYLTPILEVTDDNFTDVVYLEGERYWIGAQKLELQGNTDWMVITSNHVPWLKVLTGERMAYILSIVLIMLAVSGIILIHMMYRFGYAQSQKIDADLDHLATHDDITGQLNRVGIQKAIEQAIIQAHGQDYFIALLYLDIDRFKAINDSYGYLFGNQVLQAVGEKLSQIVRSGDKVAYFSGNRFLILLDRVPHKDEVRRLTRQIMEGLKQPLIVQLRELHLMASIGVSLYPEHGETANMLIQHADVAVYEAKKAGRDNYQLFTSEIGKKTQEDIDLEIKLQAALTENQFHLVYQPKVSLQDGKIVGCEALLRWTHPELGAIPPARFIPIAEKAGLIASIGDWALTQACKQAKIWFDQGLDPACVAVNLSTRQFLRRNVVEWVADVLRSTGLPAHCLELELTESLLPQDMDRAMEILNQLSSLGIKLSLDDFGTGYSNLSYLKRLRINTLKIDQAFVRAALNSPQDAAIVRTIVDLAHNLGLKALAEGVETSEQLQFVREQECDEIQGYYFSRPVALETYTIMLRDDIRLEGVS